MSKSIIIIGAGIAGLSAGCYAQMNGFETMIFELHNKPGGVCTSWRRKDFIFDYCIHNLFGTVENKKAYQIWRELGALKDTEIIRHDSYVKVEDNSGESLELFTDLDRLERQLREIAPEDGKVIDEYINAVHSFVGADFPSLLLGYFMDKLKMLPYILSVRKWSKITLKDFSHKFTNHFLQKAFPHLQYNLVDYDIPMLINLFFLAGLSEGDLAWPWGGSLNFSQRIANRYEELGGQIEYGSKAEKILIDENKVYGVKLDNEKEYNADILISAADGYKTIYKMLDGKYTTETIDLYYKSYPKSVPFGLTVYLGVNMDLTKEPSNIVLLLKEPLELEQTPRDSIFIEIFNSNTGLASPGKSVIKVVLDGNYGYWEKLSENKENYLGEKEKIAHKIIDLLEYRFPGIKENTEIWDVATPFTVEKYTENFQGQQAWTPPDLANEIMTKGISKTLPNLKNFYMVGQWAGGSIGISTVAIMARNLIQELCKNNGKKFKTLYSY
jgi:phytoene dehydrogenase-like protein